MILGDNTYYVSSSTTNDCPQPCHPLSYYITHTAAYFTSNVTFIFMEGEHLLDSKGSVKVVINNVGNITFKGERGHSGIEPIIKCSSTAHGIVFNNSSIITIYGIVITECGQQDVSPLLFINIASLYIHHITLYNNTYYTSDIGGTLYIYCVTDTHITITNSAFTSNTVGGDGGGLLIYSDIDNIHNNITITNSAFTNNAVDGNGGGLLIYSDANIMYNNIIIINSTFTNDAVGGHGSGLYIHSDIDTHNNIAITNSTFTNSTVRGNGGGLLVYSGTNNMTITNSVFTNNTVGDIGGGLYIHSDIDIHNNITITNSAFTSNTVGGDGGGLLIYSGTNIHNNVTITNSAFNNNTVGGYGGGLNKMFPHTDVHNDITIINSTFANNKINGSGGGLYTYSYADIHNNINIINSAFTNNTVDGHGGGLFILYFYNGIQSDIIVTNSVFTNNTVGKDGGGLVLYIHSRNDIHNNIAITNSAFTNNVGCGLLIYSETLTQNNVITNSIFTDNNGSGVFLSYTFFEVNVIFSRVVIARNTVSGIIALNHVTVVFTEGHSIVANNSSPTDGGGIYLGKNSYLTTSNGHISLINNTSNRYGGAIYSLDKDYYYVLFILSQCTIYDLSATFINNSAAMAGDQLYGGVFILCEGTWTPENYIDMQDLLKCSNVPDTIKNPVSSVHPLSPVSSHPLVVCPYINGTVNCTVRSLDRQVYPGQTLDVSLVTVGLCGGVSPGYIHADYDKQINLILSGTTDNTPVSCTTLYYTVKVTTNIASATVLLDLANSNILDKNPISVHLSILPCPLGLMIDFTSGDCICNNDISHISGIICDISWMPYPILRSDNNWIAHPYENHNCTIVHIGCPFDYCNTSSVKFELSESDLQCNYNRSGILCGKCIQGLSLMLGSNRCANCTDTALVSVSIIILAAVAGIVLVILLIVVNLTVSVGSINGLLFYANIVKLNESVFFSQGNIPVITQFISWCNLDLGFEYCFIDGLDGYIKTWLQFVFPLYVWFLIIVIIVGCRYSGRLSHLCGRSAVPVLATLILMSYTKLSRTVTNALMMNTLQCGEYKWNVWNVDANIEYLGGEHIVLFTVSLLFLTTGLVYTGLVFSSQWLQRYSGKCCKSTRDPVVRLKPLIDAYTGPFKDKYRFWTGLCLIVRLMLTVMFSFTTTLQSKLNNYIILLIVNAMILLLASGRVYKDKRLTILEISSYVNIICLCITTVLFTDSYSHVVSINVIVSVSVSIEILLFVVIVTVHCYLAFKKVFPNCELHCKTRVLSEEEAPLIASADDIDEGYLARTITRREELIFDFYLNEEHP